MAKSDAMMPQELEKSELEQVQNKRQREGLQDAQQRDDLRAIMAMPQGRRFLWRVLGLTGMNASGVDLESVNRTFYRAGQRQVGLDIAEMVQEHCSQEYLNMIQEHMED